MAVASWSGTGMADARETQGVAYPSQCPSQPGLESTSINEPNERMRCGHARRMDDDAIPRRYIAKRGRLHDGSERVAAVLLRNFNSAEALSIFAVARTAFPSLAVDLLEFYDLHALKEEYRFGEVFTNDAAEHVAACFDGRWDAFDLAFRARQARRELDSGPMINVVIVFERLRMAAKGAR